MLNYMAWRWINKVHRINYIAHSSEKIKVKLVRLHNDLIFFSFSDGIIYSALEVQIFF